MFATQLKELESHCADIAQVCRRVSIKYPASLALMIYTLSKQIKRKIPSPDSKQNFQFTPEVQFVQLQPCPLGISSTHSRWLHRCNSVQRCFTSCKILYRNCSYLPARKETASQVEHCGVDQVALFVLQMESFFPVGQWRNFTVKFLPRQSGIFLLHPLIILKMV